MKRVFLLFGLTAVPLVAFGISNIPTPLSVTGNVSVVNMPFVNVTGTVPVSGTFWPATQPVSGTVTADAGAGVWKVDLSSTTPNAVAIKVDGSAVVQPVSGTFWQATQPVSGTFFQVTQPVSIATAPTTPVTGTFWQATQPVSIASMPSTPVTGTFFQATQPVSIATMPSTPVTGTFWQATQPVSGTFFQATQPVSLAIAPTTPVTGTFWQATQPVSGTVTANAGTGTFAVSGPLTDAQLRATAVPVSGTVAATQSGTWNSRTQDGAGVVIGSAGSGTGLTVTCTNCGGTVQGQTYFATSVRVASSAATKDYLNLFNASASGKILKINKVQVSSDNTAVVTGLGWTAELDVTSTVGTTCTAVTVRLADSNNAAVPAQVTASHTCTTDPVVTFQFAACQLNTDEAAVLHGPAVCYEFANNGGQPLTLREGQGLMIRTSNAVAPAGLVTTLVEFTM